MKFFSIQLKIYLFKIVAFLTLVFSVATAWVFWFTTNPQAAALLSGISTGLFVGFLQLLLSWNEHHEIETIKKLGIRQIKAYREGKDYYERLITDSRKEILVLGVTAQRFMEDFANEARIDSRALIDALNRNVKVRILIPHLKHLSGNNLAKAGMAEPRLKKLSDDYPTFQFRHFDHTPAHSIVVADNECLVGPVFNHVESKDSPAIHLSTSSPYVREYLNHFENEWTLATTP